MYNTMQAAMVCSDRSLKLLDSPGTIVVPAAAVPDVAVAMHGRLGVAAAVPEFRHDAPVPNNGPGPGTQIQSGTGSGTGDGSGGAGRSRLAELEPAASGFRGAADAGSESEGAPRLKTTRLSPSTYLVELRDVRLTCP